MAEHFGFFDAMQDVNGGYDREYNGEQFTIPFKTLITNGVARNVYEELEVTTNGSNMVSTIKKGVAFINGHHYFNDGNLDLTHDIEVLGLSRIDRVVIRMDTNPEARHVRAFIRKGTPSANPVPPTLTRNETVYEISLAKIVIVGGQGFIEEVIDERGSIDFCPWASSNILPSYDDNMLAQHVDNGGIHVTQAQKNTWNNLVLQHGGFVGGSTLNFRTLAPNKMYQVGSLDGSLNAPPEPWGMLFYYVEGGYHVQKYICVSTTNEYINTSGDGVSWGAWRKTLNKSDYDTLFNYVSNGKSLVANAITGKGVATSATAEFATMAANILAIVSGGGSGKKFFVGSYNASSQTGVTVGGLGLDFEPSIMILQKYTFDVGPSVSIRAKANAFGNQYEIDAGVDGPNTGFTAGITMSRSGFNVSQFSRTNYSGTLKYILIE